ARKKAEKEAKIQREFEELYQLIGNRSFVLEAEYLSIARPGKKSVRFMINFVMIDSAEAVFQYGFDGRNTWNGSGGETFRGKIVEYNLTKNDKRCSVSLMVEVNTQIGAFEIIFSITSAESATAWVSGSWGSWGYEGRMVSLKNSRVYVGQSL
ncbi:MAG: DUF4251 domain-containing protein, partial [Bacteroidota bacterium]